MSFSQSKYNGKTHLQWSIYLEEAIFSNWMIKNRIEHQNPSTHPSRNEELRKFQVHYGGRKKCEMERANMVPICIYSHSSKMLITLDGFKEAYEFLMWYLFVFKRSMLISASIYEFCIDKRKSDQLDSISLWNTFQYGAC